MSESGVKTHEEFILPPSVVSKIDVSHLVAEAERADNELTAEAVGEKVGSFEHPELVLADQFKSFLDLNNIQLDDSHDRTELIKQLRQLKDAVPVVHMTFAVLADRESLQQLVKWFREATHPQTVIEVGLQPALVAGVYLRTPNHIHDFSLRAALDGRHDALVEELEALHGSK